ncbi:Uncharacterised protein [Vibrio cholerae]|nr:Uncharacterised protein [Vibrio cholerae]
MVQWSYSVAHQVLNLSLKPFGVKLTNTAFHAWYSSTKWTVPVQISYA